MWISSDAIRDALREFLKQPPWHHFSHLFRVAFRALDKTRIFLILRKVAILSNHLCATARCFQTGSPEESDRAICRWWMNRSASFIGINAFGHTPIFIAEHRTFAIFRCGQVLRKALITIKLSVDIRRKYRQHRTSYRSPTLPIAPYARQLASLHVIYS
jgi:hypothetical protein